jgi:hypothetical protein
MGRDKVDGVKRGSIYQIKGQRPRLDPIYGMGSVNDFQVMLLTLIPST